MLFSKHPECDKFVFQKKKKLTRLQSVYTLLTLGLTGSSGRKMG